MLCSWLAPSTADLPTTATVLVIADVVAIVEVFGNRHSIALRAPESIQGQEGEPCGLNLRVLYRLFLSGEWSDWFAVR